MTIKKAPYKDLPYHLVETDPEVRFEKEIDHHPKSREIINAMIYIDKHFNNLEFDIRVGGDGDYGESLMYLLDVYFDALDVKTTNK